MQDEQNGDNDIPSLPQVFVADDGAPLKIFLLHNIPSRSAFKSMIEARGGVIPRTEIGADYIIGDHLKPAGGGKTSYKWIEECCREGILVDDSQHTIQKQYKLNRPSGQRNPIRTEFTPLDDKILLDFIKRQKGASLSGVKIYESLYEAYPHHPAQSWRNRWVKNLSQRHNLDIEAVPTESSPPRTFGFSREEDGIILSSIRQPDANPEDEEFWESLAATHISTGHTAQEWRKRYFERIKPEIEPRTQPAAKKQRTKPPTVTPKPMTPKPATPVQEDPEPVFVDNSFPSHNPITPHQQPRASSTAPRYSLPAPRASSIPVARRVSEPPRQSHLPVPDIIYRDPDRRTTIYRQRQMEDDDRLIEHHIQEPLRTHRVRVSMGDVVLEIETNSSPHLNSTPFDGASGRRRGIGMVPSTPGSSPVKFKKESSRDEDETFPEIFVHEGDGLGFDMDEMDVVHEEVGFGPDTQAVFAEEDLSIPNVVVPSSPVLLEKVPVEKNSVDDLEDWINMKAEKHNLDPEIVWWILERTTGRRKIAAKVLKTYTKTHELPNMAGVWTLEEDQIALKGDAHEIEELDEKHGFNASASRARFLRVWRKKAKEISR